MSAVHHKDCGCVEHERGDFTIIERCDGSGFDVARLEAGHMVIEVCCGDMQEAEDFVNSMEQEP